MTPLEIARQRDSEYCSLLVHVNGWYYCEKSGKMMHPYCVSTDGKCLQKCKEGREKRV